MCTMFQVRTLQEQDLSNNIDKERRKSNLSRKIRDYTEDIRRQVKTKEGIVLLFKLKLFEVCEIL